MTLTLMVIVLWIHTEMDLSALNVELGDYNQMMDSHASQLVTEKKREEISMVLPETVSKKEEVNTDSKRMALDILVNSWMIFKWDGVDNTSVTETPMKVTSDMVK